MKIGWTTTSSIEDAERLARESVDQKLAACVQIEGPIRSVYIWEGKLTQEEEYRVSFKFIEQNTEKLETWLFANHPYAVPQWLTVNADRVHPGYLKWVKETTAPLSTEFTPDLRKAVSLSKKGNELMKKKRYREAEKVFQEALEIDGNNTYILVGLGDLYREMKKYHDAINHYEKVLVVDPQNVFALRGIGDSYRGLHQSERAIYYWNRYLEFNRDDFQVMTRIADAFVKIGNFGDSETYYLKALEKQPEDKYALLGIGSLYYKNEEYDKALAFFEKLLSIDENYVAVLTMVGNIYRRRQDYELAAIYYEKAALKDPWNTFALYGLGDSLRGLKNYREAVRWWSMILEREPKNQNLHTRVGDALVNMGDYEKAAEHYEKSLQVGFDQYALLGLAKVHRNNKKLDEAEACCRKVLAQIPDDRRSLEELAAICDDLGDTAQAEEIRSRLAAID